MFTRKKAYPGTLFVIQVSREWVRLLWRGTVFVILDFNGILDFNAGGATTKSSDHEVVRFEIAISRDRRILWRNFSPLFGSGTLDFRILHGYVNFIVISVFSLNYRRRRDDGVV